MFKIIFLLSLINIKIKNIFMNQKNLFNILIKNETLIIASLNNCSLNLTRLFIKSV